MNMLGQKRAESEFAVVRLILIQMYIHIFLGERIGKAFENAFSRVRIGLTP